MCNVGTKEINVVGKVLSEEFLLYQFIFREIYVI